MKPRLVLVGDRAEEAIAEATHLVPAIARADDLRQKQVNVFACPVCHKRVRTDHEMEPACTGPSETRDDHPMAVMVRVAVTARLRQW